MRYPPSILALLLCIAPAVAQGPPLPAKFPPDPLSGPPFVTAKAWAVADAKTGDVLWGEGQTTKRPMASTTKIMTAFVVLSLAADDPKVLDETVTFSAAAAKTEGSSAKLLTGEKVPVRELLYGLLLPSGNDAAAAFAKHFGPRFPELGKGDEGEKNEPAARFVAEMNRRAKDLGMTATTYLDPHGLSPQNQSTAADLAKLASRAMANEAFRKYVGTRRHATEVVAADGSKREVVWENTNRLLETEGYDGVKTGTTTPAGACLVSRGSRGTDSLIVVVLGATSSDARYTDSRNLYRWAWTQRGHAGTPAPGH
jgi:D-alanyl-D-alanine carboxypeptidase (penicillin-binding protein 5/6)